MVATNSEMQQWDISHLYFHRYGPHVRYWERENSSIRLLIGKSEQVSKNIISSVRAVTI